MIISHKRFKGFTLVELLVSMAITSSIVLILSSVTSVALDTYRKSRDEARTAKVARIALDSIATDLQSLVLRRGDNNYEWLTANQVSNKISGAPVRPSSAVQLSFLTSAQDRYDGVSVNDSVNNRGGDICLVSYQLDHFDPISQGSNSEDAIYSLYRKRFDPDETFDDTNGFLGLEYEGSTGQSKIVSRVDGSSEKVVDANNFVAENIFNLTVSFLVESADSLGSKEFRRVTVSTDKGSDAVVVSGQSISTSNGGDLLGEIISIDVSVTALTDTGAKSIASGQVSSANASAFATFLEKNSREYTRTILFDR